MPKQSDQDDDGNRYAQQPQKNGSHGFSWLEDFGEAASGSGFLGPTLLWRAASGMPGRGDTARMVKGEDYAGRHSGHGLCT
jgi:hypothetical protein